MPSHGSKTSNFVTLLNTLKDVGDIAASLPYIQAVAGILSTLISIHQEFDQCREEWKTAMHCIKAISTAVDEFLAQQSCNEEQPLPVHVRKAFDGVVDSIHATCLSLEKYQSLGHMQRFWKRRELQGEAKNCVEVISKAETRLHTALLGPMAVQIDQIHRIVQLQHASDLSITSERTESSNQLAALSEDSEEKSLSRADHLYIGDKVELEAGAGGDEERDGIGGDGGGIAINNSISKVGFYGNSHILAGSGGKGINTGEGGHGGAVAADNSHSVQRYHGMITAGMGGDADHGSGGAGGHVGVENTGTTQDFYGVMKAGSGGITMGLGTGGAGGGIGAQNQNTRQYFGGKLTSGHGGNSLGKSGRGGKGGSIGSGNL
ncbi:hypothetical protein D9758_018644 [Tetrapyrgos nigripes]|uniref:Uncharacterized protein n=1 Tax=Tetrapyrgos nigripes TaxID=182062 RepID=A0A8H5FAP1_9AGAR|nr:hypothetical protein D9758_018644 [Tetrapyrgos nigripes]